MATENSTVIKSTVNRFVKWFARVIQIKGSAKSTKQTLGERRCEDCGIVPEFPDFLATYFDRNIGIHRLCGGCTLKRWRLEK